MIRSTIFILTLALGAGLSGCTKSEPARQPQGPAIELTTAAATPSPENQGAAASAWRHAATRGAVNDGDFFEAAVAGWETTGTPDYGTPSTWLSTFTAAAGTSQSVTLTPKRYYSGYPEVKTWMKAWHPAGTLGGDGKVSFGSPADGQTDVMLSGAISGSGEIAPGELVFQHCLTQIRFRIAASQAQTEPLMLTSITVKDAQLPTGLDLATDVVTYAPAADLAVPGIADGTLAFTPQGASAGSPLLVRPFEGNFLTVDIVTSRGQHAGVRATIDSDAEFLPGKAYTITLTYTGTTGGFGALEASVRVTPWQDVEGGDSDIPI